MPYPLPEDQTIVPRSFAFVNQKSAIRAAEFDAICITDTFYPDCIICYNFSELRKQLDFAEIVPVCARSGNNVDDLIDAIFKYLTYGPMFYDEDTVTDQPMKQIVAELIREKALHALNDEIPHGIAVVIDSFKERRSSKGIITDIQATIICERDSHKGIIIGKGGEMLKKIGSNARFEIEKQLDTKVNLQLWVKVKKEWRDSDILIKNFGLDKKSNEK